MSLSQSAPFCQMVRASGLAEQWTHSHDSAKFDEFGWRCTTKESGYGIETLVGNYSEEKFDLKERLKCKPLPSQVSMYYVIELICHHIMFYCWFTNPFLLI